MKIKEIYKKAKSLQKNIVFPEVAFSDRTIEAVKIIKKKKIANAVLIGDESALILRDKDLASFQIIQKLLSIVSKLLNVFTKKERQKV